MSVVEQTPFNEHVGNGVTSVFGYTFQLLDADDLKVYWDGVLQPTSIYSVSGIGSQAGGDVTFTPGNIPASGVVVLLSREIQLARDTDYQYAGELREATLDEDFNRLWQALQGQRAILNGAVRAPYPETMTPLPAEAARASRFLVFDANGNPQVSSGTGSDPALRADLADTIDPANGAALVANAVARVDSVAALRALDPPARKTVVYVEGYYTPNDGGGGAFLWAPASTQTDNGGTVIRPDSLPTNGRWERAADKIPAAWFGAAPSAAPAVNVSAIQAAIDAASALPNGGEVLFSSDTYLLSSRLFWKDNVTLRSSRETVLKIADGIDSPVIGIVDQQTTPHIVNIGAIGVVFDGNSTNSPGVTAPSAVILDPIDGAYFERCAFRNARGYGASLQYLATGVPDNNRIKNITFVLCDFHDNGIGTATPSTLFDGIDVKNCDGLTFIRCRAYGNALDGFDFRGENIELVACESFGNGGTGLEISANSNGNSQNTSVRVIGGHYHDNVDGVLISNNPAGGSGLTRVSMYGSLVRANSSEGIEFSVSSAATHFSGADVQVFANGGRGVSVLGNAEQIIFSNLQSVANTDDGVYCNAASTLQINGGLFERNGGYGYREGASANRNNIGGTLRVQGNTTGQISLNAASLLTKVSEAVMDYTPNGSAPSDVIASAATITLPEGGKAFFITGTTNITNITASHRGRVVTLQFFDVLTVVDGGNLRLLANFATSGSDTLTLMCDGVNWFEMARSAN